MNDPTIRIFWLALLTHVVAWTTLCSLTQPNLPLDMVEMTYWGQQWQWGYHKHPPLPAWIAASVWQLSGHQPIAMYLTAQLTIAATFWAVWQFAREGLSPWLALCAVGVLQACYYCTYSINDINNTIITRPFWALSILFLYRATKPDARRPLLWWSLTGVTIGLGMLSKYYIAVLVISMLAIPLLIPRTRSQLKTLGPWLMAAISLAIFSPHLWWMVNNDFVTLEYVVNRSGESASGTRAAHLLSPLRFVFTQAGAWLPVLIVAIPVLAFRQIRKSLFAIGRANQDYFRSYLLVVVLGPLLFYFLAAAITGANIRSMWGGPLFCFWGVLLIELSRKAAGQFREQHASTKIVLRNCCIAAVVMLSGLFVRNGLGPLVRDDFSRVHFPGQAVCDEVHRRWSERVDAPLEIIGGQMFPAGCVGVYSDRPVDVFANLSPKANPWLDDAAVARAGGIFIWEIDEIGAAPPSHWLDRFPGSQVLASFECPAGGLAADRMAKVGMMFVPPSKAAQRNAQDPVSSRR